MLRPARLWPPAGGRSWPLLALLALLALLGWTGDARAVLDINDRGPHLERANFNLRVTNAGIVGNAFLDQGLSNDPSFESPPGSGFELLHYGALWVGARDDAGVPHVSGGPILEFRPTLEADDVVHLGEYGRPGARRFVDDDGDGAVDEETLNGRDDDGDLEVDEDLGLFAQQIASADFTDDRPEAVEFVYPGGEQHRPLQVSVHHEAYAWSTPGVDRVAGLSFVVTNHGARALHEVRLGFYADLDSKLRTDVGGHLNDRVDWQSYDVLVPEPPDTTHTRPGEVVCTELPCTIGLCWTRLSQRVPVVRDALSSDLPRVAAVGLWHTTDPLASAASDTLRAFARAPATASMRSHVLAVALPPQDGGLPTTDADRYRLLAGDWPEADTSVPGDFVVVVECGPFGRLDPGQSLEFHVALVAAANADSLHSALGRAAVLELGEKANLIPDDASPDSALWNHGDTGRNGHEICFEPPPGLDQILLDPHCSQRYVDQLGDPLFPPQPVPYTRGRCVWTDLDCDGCTGQGGYDRIVRWSDPGRDPPGPAFRLSPLDHAVRVEWDNLPELLVRAGQLGAGTEFLGYRVWRVADWRERPSLVPPEPRWAIVASFGPDSLSGQIPIPSVTDSTVAHDRLLWDGEHFPVGRYRWDDPEVLNGFDYLYVVTTLVRLHGRDADLRPMARIAETPIAADFEQRIVPLAAAREDPHGVWVVPNPFRATAEWDRPVTYGDALTRHIDFMGLPRARATIRIYTVAGDFVAQIDHDGRSGRGEASWDLISRNGQDVASGIYLFTVNSALGHHVGRFVVIR